MIKITIAKKKISIKGHADYDEYGKDIVCAAVSSALITTVNGILSFGKTISVNQTDDETIINIIKNDHNTKVLLDNMVDMFLELEDNYKDNIKIKYEEV